MKTLELTEQNALTAYAKASDSEKKFLKNLYPGYDFNVKITDRIKSYADACSALGLHPLTISDFSKLPEKDREATYAFHQITFIARALNEGWEPDWNDHNQYKYYPYFFHAAGGSGFSCYGCYYGYVVSTVGSRLYFKTRELAEYAGNQFISIYNQFLKL